MVRERNDVAVKDILSQLSKDETVLEELRKIGIRGLTAQVHSSGDNQRARLPLEEVERDDNIDASKQKSSTEKNLVRSPLLTFMHDGLKRIISQIPQEATKQQPTATASDEELAFNISKDSDTYRNIISTVQWYRDSFLIGSAFADQRSAERQVSGEHDATVQTSNGENVQIIGNQSINQSAIPKSDPSTAMGHPLLLSAAESYIRSIAAVDLLKPYATWAVSRDGPMFQTATQSMAQSIPLAQSSCDWAMRENLLWVLKDEEWMEFAKSITTKYVDRSYKDG